MAHDVFLSYSSKDKPVADATCATLEAEGIRCWIAPRDIVPGADWGESIIDAINGSRAFVLLFSNNANLSVQIKREVERAVNRGLPVIPFRIENVMPARSLEYFLSTPHWLDAFTPPLEKHLEYLAKVIASILEGRQSPEPPPPPKPTPLQQLLTLDRRVLAGGGAAAVAVVAFLGWAGMKAATPPSFTGKWTAQKIQTDPDGQGPFGMFSIRYFVKPVMAAGKLTGDLDVTDLGQYRYGYGGEDSGTVRITGQGKAVFTSDLGKQPTDFTYFLVKGDNAGSAVGSLGGKPGESAIALMTMGTAQSMLVGTSSGPGLTGHWYTHTPANPAIGAVDTVLDIAPDGHYHYRFRIAESGIWQASDGKWTRSPQGMGPVSGTYRFDGSSQVTTVSATGTTVWTRAD